MKKTKALLELQKAKWAHVFTTSSPKSRKQQKWRWCQSKYLVGLREGAQSTHITTKSEYASKVQKAGMIQATCHSSLSGSVALKYSWANKGQRRMSIL
jgi:hypothetical protein